MPVTRAMALEQIIDGIDDRIDKLNQKFQALQKDTYYHILELTKKEKQRER